MPIVSGFVVPKMNPTSPLNFLNNPVTVFLNDGIHLLIISIRSPNGNLQLGWSLLYKIVNMGIDGVNLGLDAINRPKRDFWRKCLGKCLEMCEMFTNFADFFKQT